MFTRARLAGLWILGSVISPAELEHLDDYSLAIDGDGGGTYAPSTAIVIGGSGVTLSGANHHVSGTLTVDNLAVISIASGGSIKAEGSGTADITLATVSNVGTLTVGSGAVVKINSGGALDVYGSLTLKNTSGPGSITAEQNTTVTLASGATMTAASGSTVNLAGSTAVRGAMAIKSSGGPGSLTIENGTTNPVAGLVSFVSLSELRFASGSDVTGTIAVSGGGTTITLEDGIDITLSPAVAWSSPRTILHVLSYAGASTGPANPDAWTEISDLFNAPCLVTSDRTASGGKSLIEFTELPPGADIAQVTITTKGTVAGSIASTRPQYQIVSWDDSSANGYTSHSALTTDSGSIATFPLNATQTTIAVSGATTVTAGRRYGLAITHPFQITTGQGVRVYEATISGTVTEYRKG